MYYSHVGFISCPMCVCVSLSVYVSVVSVRVLRLVFIIPHFPRVFVCVVRIVLSCRRMCIRSSCSCLVCV